ncbi:MAG: hypothetical protein HY670_08925 [Chloroflexi bacterium]|nr:hypothetical protein [Chloroflexota bacterium]
MTAAYYAVNFFSFPLVYSLQYLSGVLLTYFVALGLTISLPYFVNSDAVQRLQSRAIAEERLRLGREIHDSLCQTIYGLRLELRLLRRDISQMVCPDKRLAHLEALVDEANKEARESIELLRSIRDDRSFLPQIKDSLEHFENETGISYELAAPGEEPYLDDIVKLEVLAICEEALRNVAKHSAARRVMVRVFSPNGHLQVNIADDGRGMGNVSFAGGHGLTVMKERAESIGGNLQVVSVPGSGTEISVEVPRRWLPQL